MRPVTVNAALRRVERTERLRRGAEAILRETHDQATPDDLRELRGPRLG